MKNHIQRDAIEVLEARLQEKITEYEQAESTGKQQAELNILYQETKDLKHQISFFHPWMRKAVG